jgi:hypothetical protein
MVLLDHSAGSLTRCRAERFPARKAAILPGGPALNRAKITVKSAQRRVLRVGLLDDHRLATLGGHCAQALPGRVPVEGSARSGTRPRCLKPIGPRTARGRVKLR